jgi:hypothetical protein
VAWARVGDFNRLMDHHWYSDGAQDANRVLLSVHQMMHVCTLACRAQKWVPARVSIMESMIIIDRLSLLNTHSSTKRYPASAVPLNDGIYHKNPAQDLGRHTKLGLDKDDRTPCAAS